MTWRPGCPRRRRCRDRARRSWSAGGRRRRRRGVGRWRRRTPPGAGSRRRATRGSRRRCRAARARARRSRSRSKTAAAEAIGAAHLSGSRCCEPTWKLTPSTRRPERRGVAQDGDGLGGRAAVLARQRPVRALARGDQAAQDPGAGGGLGDLLDLAGGVDHEQLDAEAGGEAHVLATLDRVGVDELLGAGAGQHRGGDLGGAGDVEAAAGAGQRGQQRRVRVGLDRVVHRGARAARPRGGGSSRPRAGRRARGTAWAWWGGGAARAVPRPSMARVIRSVMSGRRAGAGR